MVDHFSLRKSLGFSLSLNQRLKEALRDFLVQQDFERHAAQYC
jgi:hypothetical protein